MRATPVLFYTQGGETPVRQWLDELRRHDRRAFAKCVVRIQELSQYGHELRHPAADLLRDGIHELRARQGHVQYRILYFFHGRWAAVLAHAIVKEGWAVPEADIERALHRKVRFLQDPRAHALVATLS
jgi:phage-related protein